MKVMISFIILCFFILLLIWINSNPMTLDGYSLLQLDFKKDKPAQFVLFGENGICSILKNGKWEVGRYTWSIFNQQLEYKRGTNIYKKILLEKSNNSSFIAISKKKNEMPIVVWKMNKKKILNQN